MPRSCNPLSARIVCCALSLTALPTPVGYDPSDLLPTCALCQSCARLDDCANEHGTLGTPSHLPQVALGIAQDLTRQLPYTVLPTVVSAWVAMVQGKVPQQHQVAAPPRTAQGLGAAQPGSGPGSNVGGKGSGGGGDAGGGGVGQPGQGQLEQPGQGRAGLKRGVTLKLDDGPGPGVTPNSPGTPAPGMAATAAGAGAGGAGAGALSDAAAVAASPAGAPARGPGKGQFRPVGSARAPNRARQLKMTESMSEQALQRWWGMEENERRMMVQVGTQEGVGGEGGDSAVMRRNMRAESKRVAGFLRVHVYTSAHTCMHAHTHAWAERRREAGAREGGKAGGALTQAPGWGSAHTLRANRMHSARLQQPQLTIRAPLAVPPACYALELVQHGLAKARARRMCFELAPCRGLPACMRMCNTSA